MDWDPSDAPLLGEYDGLLFTVAEGRYVLDFVNDGTGGDFMNVGLNSSVVTTLLGQRPFESVRRLSEAPGVGPAALERLRNAVPASECRHHGT